MAAGGLKVWNGSSWVSSTPKVWSGSAWTPVTNGYVWSGSAWTPFYNSTVTLYNGGTIQGYLVRYDDAGTTGFGNPLGYTDYYGWFNNNGTAPSPSTLTDGKTLAGMYNYYHYSWAGYSNVYTQDSIGSAIEISGFSSDPGYSYITSAKLGSSTLLTTSSLYYSYAGGRGVWFMQGGMFTIGQTGTYTGYIYQ